MLAGVSEGKYCFHLHGRNVSQGNQQNCLLFTSCWLLAWLIDFDPEEGCTAFLWNIGKFVSDYTAFIVTAMRANIFSCSRYYAMTVRWAVIPDQFLDNGSLNTFPRQWKTVKIREWTVLPARLWRGVSKKRSGATKSVDNFFHSFIIHDLQNLQ
jgi:hypothetical protein